MRSLAVELVGELASQRQGQGVQERPDMYISSLGSSPAATSTGKVLVSLTPNSRPFSAHRPSGGGAWAPHHRTGRSSRK